MTEDRLLATLKAEIGTIEAVQPVRLRRPLALGLVILTVFAAGGLMWFLGLRNDRPLLGDHWLWGLSLFQAALAIPLWRAAVREALPARRSNLAFMGWAASTAVLTHWGVAFLTHQHSPVGVPADSVWQVGGVCFGLELALGIPLVAWVVGYLRRRCLVTEPWRVGWVAGLAAGILGDSLWRLFCPYSDAFHILTFHTTGVVVVALGSLGIAALLR